MVLTEPTSQQRAPSTPPDLAPRELLRWAWRQLTSMRTALLLLLALSLAAVPGSLVPQRKVSPAAVAEFGREHPSITPIFERLGLFDVYTSAWFSAVYLLLLVSLVGCVVPRTRRYWRAARARPAPAPARLDRLAGHTVVPVDAGLDDPLGAVTRALRRRRYRVTVDGDTVCAEKGYLREAANLTFHLSVLVILVGVAVGALFGYRGGVIVVEGHGFANTLTQYDEFAPGARFDPDALPPFSFTVRDFAVRFQRGGPQSGAARSFAARVSYSAGADGPERTALLRVNHPLNLAGTSVHLLGHGYAPQFTVRDGRGAVAFSGPVAFLPQDGSFTSTGVVKVPDAVPIGLAFEGFFLPTYAADAKERPVSVFPDALNPVVGLLAYAGDLGLNSGVPQSVYALDTDQLRVLERRDGSPYRMLLRPGQSRRLPAGLGTISFDGWDRWVELQVGRTPGKGLALAGVLALIAGLLGMLYVHPVRLWARVVRAGPHRSVVELAGVARGGGAGDGAVRLGAEIGAVAAAVAPDGGRPGQATDGEGAG